MPLLSPYAGKRMDEDVKLDEDAVQKMDKMEVATESPDLTKRPRVRMKKRKKVLAAEAARLTTTPSSVPFDVTTIPSEELPLEHRSGQGIDLDMAEIVSDDIDLSAKNAELVGQRFRSRNKLKNQNGIVGGAVGKEEGDVIKVRWRQGSSPRTPSSESTREKGRGGGKYREKYPVIVCDDPNECPTPIYDHPPTSLRVHEFGGRRKAGKIIPPAFNVKPPSRGKRPVSEDGRRRFKPFRRTKDSQRRNNTVSGESDRLVVPQRLRVKDFAKEVMSRKEAAASRLKTRKKTMRRKMRPVGTAARVTMTSTVATTTEESGEGGGPGAPHRPMRPFRRRRPTTTSPLAAMDGAGGAAEGEAEDLQLAEETTTQHVPLDMVLMRDMSLPELEEFMANKVKEMNKKIKRVMKGHMNMENKGDSAPDTRPRMRVSTPAPTALASTTSFPAVPQMDLRRTTSRDNSLDDDDDGEGVSGGRPEDPGTLFLDQLRIR